MSWDPVWEKIFNERPVWGEYPPEELVRFISTNYYSVPKRSDIKILEIGCGPGGGPSWYIAREGFAFYGIDGSATAIEKAKKRFEREGLHGEFVVGDIAKLPWPNETFDCVVDVVSLQCNSEEGTRDILREVYRVLKPGGKQFSLTAKAGCWGDGSGTRIDNTSYKDVEEGPFRNMGVIRFATKESLESLYSDFNNLEIDYSVRSVNREKNTMIFWITSCTK